MQDEPFSCTIHRVLVLNPVLSISSPGFQKSSPGFVKHESGFFSSPGPGFSRVRIFFESESGSESGFRSMPVESRPVCLGLEPYMISDS